MTKSLVGPFLALFICIAGSSRADDIIINASGTGGSAPTIQAGIDIAVSGDRIILNGGTYYEENIVIDGKEIWITYGDGFPVLQAPSPGSGTAFTLANTGAGCVIWGTIYIKDFDTGISIEGGSPQLSFIQMSGCGTGIRVSGASSAPAIEYNLIDQCTSGISIEAGVTASIENQTIVGCLTGISISSASVSVSKSIIDGCGTGISCSGTAPVLFCNDLWENTVNYSGFSESGSDFFEDPMFCLDAAVSKEYWLQQGSPCFKDFNACGVNLGAFTLAGCPNTPAEATSWGNIKQLYSQ